MSPELNLISYQAVGLAVGASIIFSLSTLVFKKFSIEVSPLWMNTLKCLVASVGFLIMALILDPASLMATLPAMLALMLSGLIGLNVGDLFLMRSFRSIGSGRTLMIFSFNPLFISVASYFIFSQALKPTVFIGIVFLSACLLMLGLESFQREKAWKLSGYFQALLAAFLDSTGVLLTRWAFEEDSSLTLASANFLRGAGALLGFFILSRYYPIYIWSRFKSLELRLKKLVLTVCVLGTFVSLLMWLGAVRIGPLGVVSAVSVTGPLLVTVVETYVEGRRAGWQLYLAVAFFLLGVWVINFMAS